MGTKEEALAKVAGKRTATYEIEGYGEVVFVQPTRPVYMRLMSQIQDDKTDPAVAMLAFVKACAVYPSGAELDALLDDYPGLLNEAGGTLQDLAKPEAQAIVKKG